MTEDKSESPSFGKLLEYIKSARGIDFTGYKTASLSRRIQKRLSAVNIGEIEDYVDYLEVHPEEFALLFNDLLINVTSFFRDEEAWKCIADEVIPNIVANTNPTDPIRIWSAGCASGEEACTIAILFAEAIGIEEYSRRVKIYATDIDESALAEGRHAVYGAQKLEHVPEAIRDKYFSLSGQNYALCSELRRALIFGRHDLVQDAPISRISLLSCRNTLMYFNSETQNRIISRFHYSLLDGGYLFVGKAEMLLTPFSLFSPHFLKHRIFCKVPGAPNELIPTRQNLVPNTDARVSRNATTLGSQAFEVGTRAQVILDGNGFLVRANQLACSMFHLVMSDLGRPFQDLEMSYRPLELRSVIEHVTMSGQAQTVYNIARNLPDGVTQVLDVQVETLATTGAILISFEDVTPAAKLKQNFDRAVQELETTNEELHSAQEELETTNEELQSTNEELETTNEELQSSNEELETMNEELASTNDELEMTNTQLRSLSKDVNLDRVFLQSIMANINSAIIAVDTELKILSWNRRSEDLWGLRADEALQKPLDSLDIGLPISQVVEHIKSSLSKRTPFEEFRLESVNRRGRKFVAEVKITPVTIDGRITTIILLIDARESLPA